MLSLLGIITVSCQIMQSNQLPKKALNTGQLGTIGKFSSSGLLSNEFEEVGAIKLIKPIKIQVNPIAHKTKKIDSVYSKLQTETNYVKLKIIDEINFIANLNSIENINYLNFLKENSGTFIRAEGVWEFSTEQAATLLNARSVYLINDGLSNYVLQASMPHGKVKKIYFDSSKIYKAEYMNTCWQENNRGTFLIAALKNKGRKCSGNTKQDVKDLEKEDLFDKFYN